MFIRFNGLRHPETLGGTEVEAFLSWLANERNLSASTHKQALSALLFLYGKVLGKELSWMTQIGRPRTQRHLPVVLAVDEVARILAFMDGEHRLFAQLLYGTGTRITEALQLRTKDVDFERGAILTFDRAAETGAQKRCCRPRPAGHSYATARSGSVSGLIPLDFCGLPPETATLFRGAEHGEP